MKWTDSIEVNGICRDVFSAYTNGRKTVARSPDIIEFWEISATPGLVGSESGWLFLHGRMCLEVIETLVDFSPPNRLESTIIFTRFLPLVKEMLSKHEFAILGDELESIFRATYGRQQPTGEMCAIFEETATGTRITQTLDLKMGGTVGFFNRFSKFAKRSPLAARLEIFRDHFEGDPT